MEVSNLSEKCTYYSKYISLKELIKDDTFLKEKVLSLYRESDIDFFYNFT